MLCLLCEYLFMGENLGRKIMEFEIKDGKSETKEVSFEEYCRQLLIWWNEGYVPQHNKHN